jgi:hypothetical protein
MNYGAKQDMDGGIIKVVFTCENKNHMVMIRRMYENGNRFCAGKRFFGAAL